MVERHNTLEDRVRFPDEPLLKLIFMINNENNEYIVLSKALYKKYGFVKGLIIQTLVDNGGEFIGSTGQLSDVIGVVSNTSIKTHLKEMVDSGIIKKKNVDGWINEYTLATDISVVTKKHKVPESVQRIVKRLDELKKKKQE